MDWRGLVVDAARLWRGEAPIAAPLVILDLDARDRGPEELVLPACPVIGVGKADAPLAGWVDAVVEPPVAIEGLTQAIVGKPLAAAAIVDLLRLLPLLPAEQGLVAESLTYAVLQGSGEHRAWQAQARRPSGQPMPQGQVEVSRDGAVLHLVLDRAEAGNAIDRSMRDGLHDALQLAALDPGIERVVLGGRGKAFSLGADLGEFGTTGDPALAHAIRRVTLPARMALACADKLEVHVQGGCVGSGLELAAYARRITATPTAWFQLPELAMGILPGAGGCVSLVRRIGRQRAGLMILSGKRLSARQALAWGLIDAIVDDPA